MMINKRGTKKNLQVMEVKRSGSAVSASFEKSKLKAFLREPLNYEFWLFIKFEVGPRSRKPELEWFSSSHPS